MTSTDLRKADLAQLAAALEDQRTRAIDLVTPAKSITFDMADLRVEGAPPAITEAGVTDPNGVYRPTVVADEGIADRLGIPLRYLRRMRAEDPELYDANVNSWLLRDNGSCLLRLLRGDEATETRGVLRAVLSDRFRAIDNLDVLLATLQGMRDAGVELGPGDIHADLTDRRMYVRVVCPQVSVYAPDLLAGYRSPFDGRDVGNGWTPERVARAAQGEGKAHAAGSEPIIFAGFVITNSDVGNGAFTITPRLTVEICGNGLTVTADAMREVHLGAKLSDTGIVKWSQTTARKNLELITSQAADAVAAYLNRDYVTAKVTQMQQAAGVPVQDAPAVITAVSKKLGFTEEQQTNILNHFIAGGQLTAGGVMQAVTSAAQLVADGDIAHAMESASLPALELAAAAARR